MQNQCSKRHVTDLLFTIGLFCVFAVSALVVLLVGANVYKSVTQQSKHNYTARTSLAYISEKMRQNDTANSITIEEQDGITVLKLHQIYNDKEYVSCIYNYEGELKELFAEGNTNLPLSSGNTILEIQDFSVSLKNTQTLYFEIKDSDGQIADLTITPASDQKEVLR